MSHSYRELSESRSKSSFHESFFTCALDRKLYKYHHHEDGEVARAGTGNLKYLGDLAPCSRRENKECVSFDSGTVGNDDCLRPASTTNISDTSSYQ